jgi:hypothetical protein
MNNLKLKVIIFGISGIAIISIILALVLDIQKYGPYIAIWDILSSISWVFLGSYIVNSYLNHQKTNELSR